MDITYFLKTCSEDIVYRDEVSLTVFFDNDIHDILVEYDIVKDEITNYEPYNSLTDESFITLDEEQLKQITNYIKTNLL